MIRALIIGTTGQDGSYLSELLLSKGCEVHGIKRRSSSFNTARLDHIFEHERFQLHYGDICDGSGVTRLLKEIEPQEIYNLAAQSHVKVSFEVPEYTSEATGMGALKLFEAVRGLGLKTRIYQASSSEMFGNEPTPQSERTPLRPRSPYGCAKVFAHNCAVNYRESYGMFISCGILFNHESERRGETFVTRKIAMGVAAIKAGLTDSLALGNLDARRDWGYAPEYVEAMWRMLQQDKADDFVIGTGATHSVGEFCQYAFAHVGLNWRDHVTLDEKYRRPAEVDELRAETSKARIVLDWRARTDMRTLAGLMVDAEMKTPTAMRRAA